MGSDELICTETEWYKRRPKISWINSVRERYGGDDPMLLKWQMPCAIVLLHRGKEEKDNDKSLKICRMQPHRINQSTVFK